MAFVAGLNFAGQRMGVGAKGSVCVRRATQGVSGARMVVAVPPDVRKEEVEGSNHRVLAINGEEEFDRALEEAGESLVVIKFYAPWCRACAKVGPMLEAIAPQYPHVHFYEVNFAENRTLCRELGVKFMPQFFFYHGDAGRVEDFACGPKRFPELVSKLNDFDRGFCPI